MGVPITLPIPNNKRSPTNMPARQAVTASPKLACPVATDVPAKRHAASSLTNVPKNKNINSPAVVKPDRLLGRSMFRSSIAFAKDAADDWHFAPMDE